MMMQNKQTNKKQRRMASILYSYPHLTQSIVDSTQNIYTSLLATLRKFKADLESSRAGENQDSSTIVALKQEVDTIYSVLLELDQSLAAVEQRAHNLQLASASTKEKNKDNDT